MRALVFFTEPNNHNEILHKDLKERFSAKLPSGFSACEMINAHDHYGVQGWRDFKQVVRLFRDTFNSVVFAMERAEPGKMLSKLQLGVKDLKKIDPGLPLIGYVTDPTKSTNFNLLAAQIPMVVTEEDRRETLLMAINVAVTSRADGRRDVEIGPLKINAYTGDTYHGETRVPFTPMQCQIMKALVRHQGETVSRHVLVDNIYGDSDDAPEGNCLEVQISRMRKTLDGLQTDLKDFGRIIQTGGGGFSLVKYSSELPVHKPGARPDMEEGKSFYQSQPAERGLQIH